MNNTVSAEFDELPNDIKAKFLHLAMLIEEMGLPAVGEPYVKHIDGKLWEMRVKAKSGYGRGFYCAWHEKQLIVLRYFIKKSAKTPPTELALAKNGWQNYAHRIEIRGAGLWNDFWKNCLS